MADKAPKVKIIDNPAVAETYANKLIGASFDGGALVVTLGTARFMPEQSGDSPKENAPPPVHVTARLALSPAGAVELANALANMLKSMNEMQKRNAPPSNLS